MPKHGRTLSVLALGLLAFALPTLAAPVIETNELAYHVLQSANGTTQAECDGAVQIYNPHASELVNPVFYTTSPNRFYYYQNDLNGLLLVPPVHIPGAGGQGATTTFFAYQCRASTSISSTQYPFLITLSISPNAALFHVGQQIQTQIAIKNNTGETLQGIRITKAYNSARIIDATVTDGNLAYDANGFTWNGFDLEANESQQINIRFNLSSAGTFQPVREFRIDYNGPTYVNQDANFTASSNLRIRVIKNTSCITGAAECGLDINTNVVQAEIINQSDIIHDITSLQVIRTGVTTNSNPNTGVDITGNIPGGVGLPITLYPENDDSNAITFTMQDVINSPPTYWFKYKAYARMTTRQHMQINDYTVDQGVLVITTDTNLGPTGGSGPGGGGGEVPISGNSATQIEVYETGPIIERIDQSKLIVEKYVAPSIVRKGETAQVTVSVSNVGDKIARDIEIVDFFPRNFVITSTNYSSITDVLGGFELGWKIEEIKPGQEIIVRYSLNAGPLVEPGTYDVRYASARVLGQEKARSQPRTLGVVGEGRGTLANDYFIDVTKELRDANPSEYKITLIVKNTGRDPSPEFVLRDYCGASVREILPPPDRLPCSWKIQLAAGETFEAGYYTTKLNNEIDYPNILGIEFEKQQIKLVPFTKLELKTREEKFWDLVRNTLFLLASLAALILLLWAIKRRWEGKPVLDLGLAPYDFVKNLFRV